MTTAVILAAGRGSRLGRYTRHTPKVLVRAGGRTLLDWHLQCLHACGIDSIVVVCGYGIERLERRGVERVRAPDWRESGSLDSLFEARPERIEGDVLVLYGDCPHHPDNVRAVLACDADIAVAGDRDWLRLWRERHAEPLLDAETYRAERGLLVAIGERAQRLDDVQAQFAGLLRFTPVGWASARRIAVCAAPAPRDMTGLLAALLRAGEPVADVPFHGRWCEIDTGADLHLCRRRLHDAQPWTHDWRIEVRRQCR